MPRQELLCICGEADTVAWPRAMVQAADLLAGAEVPQNEREFADFAENVPMLQAVAAARHRESPVGGHRSTDNGPVVTVQPKQFVAPIFWEEPGCIGLPLASP